MKKNAVYLLVIFSLFISTCNSPTEPEKSVDEIGAHTDNWSSPLVDDLNNIIHPLDGASPLLSDKDLQPLSFLGSAKIVGLGEATHGTKEFFQIKHRIFKYLVENFGFKAFAFEADMGESIYLDRYVTNGEGNLNDLMISKMHFWTWKTREVKELLEWMRQYNTGRSDAEKIHYIGVDCQYMDFQPVLIEEYFSNVKPEYLSTISPILNSIKKMNNPYLIYDNYKQIDLVRKQEIADSLNDMLGKIEAISSELISKSSSFEYNTIKQLAVNLIQANEEIYSATHVIDYRIRDNYMADNTIWASNLFGPDKKIAVWAHNGHVAHTYFSIMGTYLRGAIGNQYQVVGFSFSKGYFSARSQNGNQTLDLKKQLINTVPLHNSLNYIFFNAKYDNFILNTSDINNNSELGKFVIKPEALFMIGAGYNGNPSNYYTQFYLKNYFDVLINYDITDNAVQLNSGVSKIQYLNPDTNFPLY